MITRIENWIDNQSRWLVIGGCFVLFALLYVPPNYFSLFTVRELPFILGESRIPFLLWTVPVYVSVLVQIVVGLVFVLKGRLGRVIVVSTILVSGHVVVFWFFPTILHRTHEVVGPDWLVRGYGILCQADQPLNCFPSLHVSLAFFVGLVLWHEERWKGALFLLWAVAIAAATMTTKQHYLLDVVGGAVTATIAYYAYRWGL